jgi:hypothetical protein
LTAARSPPHDPAPLRRLSPSFFVAALLFASTAHATLAPALRCQVTKLRAAARTVQNALGCQWRALLAAAPVDPACLAAAHARFARAFARADARGECPTPGDTGIVRAVLDAFVGDATAALGGDARCAATKLAATGRRAADLLRAYGRSKRRPDAARLGRDVARAASKLGRAFAEAEGRGGCQTVGDAPVVAGRAETMVADVLCGDTVLDPGEDCDGSADAACPGGCQADCTCSLPPPFRCLAGTGPLVTLSGVSTTDFRDHSLAPSTRIDARLATFLASPANRYPINLGGGDGMCLAGGAVLGQYDRALGWEAMHDMNNAGVAAANRLQTVDGVRVDNVTDGIRPQAGPFTIREAWLTYVRDDCVENDHLRGGLIEDSLFDGCYVGVSARPSDEILASRDHGRGELLTVRRSLIRLEPMPGPRDGSPTELGHGRFFKWDRLAGPLALHANVFMAEQAGQGGPDTLGVPEHLVSCANNVMVWLGAGMFPTSLPACFTVVTDRAVWDDAVARWKARHPHVGP